VGRIGRTALFLALAGAPACEFFRELESVSQDETGTGSETGDEGDGACELADDHCEDQDRIRSCNLETGEITSVDCGLLCSPLINFTCTPVSTGQHACWCVEPGAHPLDACTGLEACLSDCGPEVEGACGEKCFGRATATTVRLYGALIHCANEECADTCAEYPDGCAACVESARAGLYGGCGVERSVCDADEDDEPDWP
jgi:hypothetical protein